MNDARNPYAGYRYPAEIISHTVWMYFRFTLSYRDVEEMLAARGILVSDEAIRQWCLKFGQGFAHELHRRAPRRGDKWHLDEVYFSINGQRYYLWRAVDQDGYVLDILVQPRMQPVHALPVRMHQDGSFQSPQKPLDRSPVLRRLSGLCHVFQIIRIDKALVQRQRREQRLKLIVR